MERYLRVLTGLIVISLGCELRAVAYNDSTGTRDLLGLAAIVVFILVLVMLAHQSHWVPAAELAIGAGVVCWIFRSHLPPIQSSIAPWALAFLLGALVFWQLSPGGLLRRALEHNNILHHP